jgi:hypothetical protein
MGLGWVARKAGGGRLRLRRSQVIQRTRIGCASEASHRREPGSERGI